MTIVLKFPRYQRCHPAADDIKPMSKKMVAGDTQLTRSAFDVRNGLSDPLIY